MKTVSRKAKVKSLWQTQGYEAAFVLAQKLKLSPNTARSWNSQWKREAEATAKIAVKAKGKKKTKAAKAEVKAPAVAA